LRCINRHLSTCKQAGGVNVDLGADVATHLNIVTAASPGM
jgi:hypothetical protein